MAQNLPPKRIAVAIELHWNLSWHLDTYQGIADYGNEHGWKCFVDPYLYGVTEGTKLSEFDGLIGRFTDEIVTRATASGVPALNLVQRDGDLPTVKIDGAACVQLACDHLVAQGYSRLGYITHTTASQRIQTTWKQIFEQTAETYALPKPICMPFGEEELEDPDLYREIRQRITRWITEQKKPIGLLVYQAGIARHLIHICEQLEIKVPEEVGIVAHDADQQTATSIAPTLSAIDLDCWEWGYQAAARLDRLMQGNTTEPRIQTVAPRRVVVRESSNAFVFDDLLVSQAMHHIAANSRQTLSGEQIAAELGVSRRTLDRRFEVALGRTLNQEVIRLRIQQLERVLSESEMTMARIAELFGFGSASQFTQFFKKHAGMTPTDYRKKYGAEK